MEKRIADITDEITVPAFERWLRVARPGDRFVYYHGNLANDREQTYLLPSVGNYVHIFSEPAHSLGSIAWHAYEKGQVELVQKKSRGGRFDYIAVKRRNTRRGR